MLFRSWLSLPGETGAPKVEVRRFTKGFLHGKAYIPEGDITGILAGSSNMTYAGLKVNRELNLGYEGPTHKHLVRDWFEELWQASEAYDLAAIYQERFAEHTATARSLPAWMSGITPIAVLNASCICPEI